MGPLFWLAAAAAAAGLQHQREWKTACMGRAFPCNFEPRWWQPCSPILTHGLAPHPTHTCTHTDTHAHTQTHMHTHLRTRKVRTVEQHACVARQIHTLPGPWHFPSTWMLICNARNLIDMSGVDMWWCGDWGTFLFLTLPDSCIQAPEMQAWVMPAHFNVLHESIHCNILQLFQGCLYLMVRFCVTACQYRLCLDNVSSVTACQYRHCLDDIIVSAAWTFWLVHVHHWPLMKCCTWCRLTVICAEAKTSTVPT